MYGFYLIANFTIECVWNVQCGKFALQLFTIHNMLLKSLVKFLGIDDTIRKI